MERNNLRNYINSSIPKGLVLGITLFFLNSTISFAQNNSRQNDKEEQQISFIEPDLNYKLFQDTSSINIIKDWANMNSFVKIEIIDRKEFINLKGVYIEPTDNNEFILYMPQDLSIQELPQFIHSINSIKVEKNNQNGSSFLDLIEYIHKHIIGLKNLQRKGQLTPELEQLLYEFDNISSNLGYKQTYQYQKSTNNKDISNILALSEKGLAMKIYDEFMESFVENGLEVLSIKICEEVRIDTDKMNTDLQNFNKSDSREKTENKIKLITNFVKKLSSYDGISDISIFDINGILTGSSPRHIYDTDTIMCVGMGLISDNILSKAGLDHYGVIFEESFHTAIIIKLSDGTYQYVDPISDGKTYNIKDFKIKGSYISWKYNGDEIVAYMGNAEDVFISELYYNKALSITDDPHKKLYRLNMAKDKCGTIPLYYKALADIYLVLFKKENKEEYLKLSLGNINKALSMDSSSSRYRYQKSKIQKISGDIKGSKLSYNKYKKLSK